MPGLIQTPATERVTHYCTWRPTRAGVTPRINQRTKFEVPSFTNYKNMTGANF